MTTVFTGEKAELPAASLTTARYWYWPSARLLKLTVSRGSAPWMVTQSPPSLRTCSTTDAVSLPCPVSTNEKLLSRVTGASGCTLPESVSEPKASTPVKGGVVSRSSRSRRASRSSIWIWIACWRTPRLSCSASAAAEALPDTVADNVSTTSCSVLRLAATVPIWPFRAKSPDEMIPSRRATSSATVPVSAAMLPCSALCAAASAAAAAVALSPTSSANASTVAVSAARSAATSAVAPSADAIRVLSAATSSVTRPASVSIAPCSVLCAAASASRRAASLASNWPSRSATLVSRSATSCTS